MEATLVLPKAIEAYFETVNRKDFEAAAGLFAQEGQLVPPFDQPIVGREAIATYLIKEASDMTFTPIECELAESELAESELGQAATDETAADETKKESARQRFAVKGKVKNSLFAVNVGWQFVLTEAGEIETVTVKLLASLKELMNIKR